MIAVKESRKRRWIVVVAAVVLAVTLTFWMAVMDSQPPRGFWTLRDDPVPQLYVEPNGPVLEGYVLMGGGFQREEQSIPGYLAAEPSLVERALYALRVGTRPRLRVVGLASSDDVLERPGWRRWRVVPLQGD